MPRMEHSQELAVSDAQELPLFEGCGSDMDDALQPGCNMDMLAQFLGYILEPGLEHRLGKEHART